MEIVGPDSHVRQVAEATTEPVSVKDATDAGPRRRDHRRGGLVGAAGRSRRTRNVTVEIWPAPVERRMPGVPVRWRNLGAGLRAQVVAAARPRDGARSAEPLAALRDDSVQAFVDLAGLGPGRYNLRVQVDPDGELRGRGD